MPVRSKDQHFVNLSEPYCNLHIDVSYSSQLMNPCLSLFPIVVKAVKLGQTQYSGLGIEQKDP